MSLLSGKSDDTHKGLLKSGVSVFILRGFGAALLLGQAIAITNLLSEKAAGAYFLVFAITFMCSIVGCLGVDKASLRHGATAHSSSNGELRPLLRTASLIVLIAAACVTAIIILGAPLIANRIFKDPSLCTPLRLMALNIVPSSLAALFAQYLYAVRRAIRATLIQAVFLPFISLALLWFAVTRYGLTGAVMAYVIAAWVTAGIGGVWALMVAPREAPGEWFAPRSLLTLGLPLFWISFLNLFINMTDTVMIGIWMDTSKVALYTAALRAARAADLILISANSVVAPIFATYWSRGDHHGLIRLQRSATLILSAVALVLSGVLIIFARPILSIFGATFVAADSALIALAIGQFVVLATGPAAFLLMMTGRERTHRNNVIFAALLNVVLNAFLIPRYGVLGAAIATAIALVFKNGAAFVLAWWHLLSMRHTTKS